MVKEFDMPSRSEGVVAFPETAAERVLRERFGEIFERFSLQLRGRLLLQEREQKGTGADEQMCVDIGKRMNRRAYIDNKRLALDDASFEAVALATRLTDLGKTGPAHATKAQQTLIARMYNIERVFLKPPHLMTMQDFLELSDDADILRNIPEHLEALKEMGLAEYNVRQFFNLHAQWTADLLRDETAIPDEVKVTAALHHILEGVNPDGLVELSADALRIPSLNRSVDGREIFTILLDKYQARRRFTVPGTNRHRTHEEQIGWLQDYVEKYVALVPYPAWLREQLLASIAVLEQAGPFPEYFAADRQEEAARQSLAAK